MYSQIKLEISRMIVALKCIITAIVCLLPSKIALILLKLIGHQISFTARIGLSFVYVEKLTLLPFSKIGHLNLIKVKEVFIARCGNIGHMNYCNGPFSVIIKEKASIGNRNVITRSSKNLVNDSAILTLGFNSKITADHRIDCMCSVTFGDNSILAGSGSQIWTHGYYHERTGPGRFRVEGSINIGNNIYIGSRCVISMGVSICDGVTIGSLSSVSKSISVAGLYVSQPLRYIDSDIDLTRKRLIKVENNLLQEIVYIKPTQSIDKATSNN